MLQSNKLLSSIIIRSKYARYLPEENRRETWDEIVTRNKEMHKRKYPHLASEIDDAYWYVYNKKVLPSMRSLQFGGAAIEKNNVRLYNCCFLPVDHHLAFSEIMFLLLCGTGVGYSLRKDVVDKLPAVKPTGKRRRFIIGDSIEGWADAVKALMKAYLQGSPYPVFDYTDIRAKGSRLSSGGLAPGPAPLRAALEFCDTILRSKAVGDKLSPIECHDIICRLSDAVLSGGIRRSAMIALFDRHDDDMLKCKSNFTITDWSILNQYGDSFEVEVSYEDTVAYTGNKATVWLSNKDDGGTSEYQKFLNTMKLPWYHFHPQRGRANNSAYFPRQEVTKEEFFSLWESVKESNAGEPGIYWTNDEDMGTNPCVETGLYPNQFCNLVTINVATVEDQADLDACSRVASFICTLQAGYTDFHYLRPIWREITERDALIGVSQTGIAAGPVLNLDLEQASRIVVSTNASTAEKIGINPAARCTCVKPEGTATIAAEVIFFSGIHAGHSTTGYMLRRVRLGKEEPIYKTLKAHMPSLMEDEKFNPTNTAVFTTPHVMPENCITRAESPLDLLERVRKWNKHWVEPGHRTGNNMHNVSCTVTIKDNEWDVVGNWMWENRDSYAGLSVLPFSGTTYPQMPFEEVSAEEFEEYAKHVVDINLANVPESMDDTDFTQEAACAGGTCDLTSLRG